MNSLKKVLVMLLAAVMLLMTAVPSAWAEDSNFDGSFVAGIGKFTQIVSSGKEAVLSLQVETDTHRYDFLLGQQNGDREHIVLEMYYDGDMRLLLGSEYDEEEEIRYYWFAPATKYLVALTEDSIPRFAKALILFLTEFGTFSEVPEALLESADIDSVEVYFKEKQITSVMMKLLSFNPWEDKSVFAGIPFAEDTTFNTDEMYSIEIRENVLPALLDGIDKILFSNTPLFSHEELIAFLKNEFGEISGKIQIYGTADFEDEDLTDEMISARIPFTSKTGEESLLLFNFGDDGYLSDSGRMYLSLVKEANGEKTTIIEVNCDDTVTENSRLELHLPENILTYAYEERAEKTLPDGRNVVAEESVMRLSPGIMEDELCWRVVIVPDKAAGKEGTTFKTYFYHGDELFTEANALLTFQKREPETLVDPEKADILYFEQMTPEEISEALMDTFTGILTNTVQVFSDETDFTYPETAQLTEE